MFTRLLLTVSLGLALQSGAAAAETSVSATATTTTGTHSYKVEEIARGLEVPWSIAFLPGSGEALVAERPGRLRIVKGGKLQPQPVPGLEGVVSKSEIGLMSVTPHPDFEKNGWIYLSHGVEAPAGSEWKHHLNVARYKFDGTSLSDRKVILEGIPAKHLHAGSRLLFGADRMLYVTVGDAGTSPAAQQMASPLGKTLRLDENGNPAPGNPFLNKPGVLPTIWTSGHRNAQGLALQPGTNAIFLAEHGPSDWDAPGGGDEVNLLAAGGDYGWPTIHHRQQHPSMIAPVVEWTPATAPGGCAFHPGTKYPGWKGDLLVAALKGECVVRVKMDGKKERAQERLVEKQYGRIREVVVAPDESIWFTTSNSDGYGKADPAGDKILRLIPN